MTNGSERPGLGTRLHVCLRVLAVLVGRLRPELYSGPDARRLTELFAWGEKLCATGKALTAQRVADTGAWESSGERSVADWLARVSGQTTDKPPKRWRRSGVWRTFPMSKRQPGPESSPPPKTQP
jgi:hypothetical protein